MNARTKLLATAILAFGFGPSAIAADAVPAYVTKALDFNGRPQWDAGRDAVRHPADILAFSQIKPSMHIVELVAGDTYYTRILSRLVGPKGYVYAVVPVSSAGPRGARLNQRAGKPPSMISPEEAEQCIQGCYPGVAPVHLLPVDVALALENISEFGSNMEVNAEDVGDGGGSVSLPEQIDAVFSANGYHELHYQDLPPAESGVPGRVNKPKPPDMIGVNKSIFDDLKPGGTYTIVDYAAAPGAGFSAADKLHRLEASAVKQEVLSAGFVLDGESSILALTSDDHSKLADGTFAARDKADQFVLRFKKPLTAPGATKRPTKAQEFAIMHNYYGNTHILNADLTGLNTGSGDRLRYHYYNADHTYQEMGRVGEGPGPLQAGKWFWDAKGNNCMLHQYPLDERAQVVCHDYVVDRPLNVMMTHPSGPRKGTKFMIVPGHVVVP